MKGLKLAIILLVTSSALMAATPDEQFFDLSSLEALITAEDHTPDEIIIKIRGDFSIRPGKADGVAQEPKLPASVIRLNSKYKVKAVHPLIKNFRRNRNKMKDLLNSKNKHLNDRQRKLIRRSKRAPKNAPIPNLGTIFSLKLDPREKDIDKILADYNADPAVEYAELNHKVEIHKKPNDPLFRFQWGLDNTGQNYPVSGRFNKPPGTPQADIEATRAWDIHTGNGEIVVAVIDTGVDYNHRDLRENMWTDPNGRFGYNFVNDTNDPADDHGHGTHCAGIIAAAGDNGLDTTGVSFDAKIMAVKFLDANGVGDIALAAKAVYYAVENGADIISNSWGGPYSMAVDEAFQYAHSQGVVLVASAGNNASDVPVYPAGLENVISVAATDSDDQKATFSNFGPWVDIAAPGVDILSTRANKTFMGIPYDNYTTIASGTSMAGPYVAGACALLLSSSGEMSPFLLETILCDSADPIDPNICHSGRLNTYRAILKALPPKGVIVLNKQTYKCSDTMTIGLFDSHIEADPQQLIDLTTDDGDFETLVLSRSNDYPHILTAKITIQAGEVKPCDGIIQVTNGRTITVTYLDEDDGTGTAVTVSKTALIDCVPPEISNIHVDTPGPMPTVFFEVNEPVTATLSWGLDCDLPHEYWASDSNLSTHHEINIPLVERDTQYFFNIELTDAAGNITFYPDRDQCSYFVTDNVTDYRVPFDYLNIQDAIDHSWSGAVISVEDGIYTGTGNYNIDFGEKAITLQSVNGPENCIIDCNANIDRPRRAFILTDNEDADTVVDGFTIRNATAPRTNPLHILGSAGGAFFCSNSAPTIKNSIITDCNTSDSGFGGAVFTYGNKTPNIINCRLINNSAGTLGQGGAIFGSAILTDCLLSNNTAASGAGVCKSDAPIENCTFMGNEAVSGSAVSGGKALIRYCTFTENTAQSGVLYECSGPVTNCLMTGNSSYTHGLLYLCKNLIDNCTIVGNYTPNSSLITTHYGNITNSIIADNRYQQQTNVSDVTPLYSCVQELPLGAGSIVADPCFIQNGYWDPNNTPAEPNDDIWIDGDYRLKPDSPCINTANYAYAMILPGTDMLANSRLNGKQLDMGCYEFGSSPDSDGDWIPDQCEPYYSNDPDSDNDELLDGIEMLYGSNARRPDKKRNWMLPRDAYSIQQALFFSRSGETIMLEKGTYYENIYFGGKNIHLTGPDPLDPCAVAATTIYGTNKPDPNGTSTGSTITMHGSEDQSCRISGLTVTGDSSGIFANSALAGINHCVIKDNPGSGINSCSGDITNSIISNNSYGGILFAQGDISNCIVRENTGFLGAGLAICSGTIRNCLIADNESATLGAGLLLCHGLITNCTIVGNTAVFAGGSIDLSEPLIQNSIIRDNFPLISFWYKPVPTYSCVDGLPPGLGSFVADPFFVDPDNGDYSLRFDSPCIDTGDPNYVPTQNEKDLAQNPRLIGNTIDIGAFEYAPPVNAQMRFIPRTISSQSKSPWIKARLKFPAGIEHEDIDTSIPATALPMNVTSVWINIPKPENKAANIDILFDRKTFSNAMKNQTNTLVTVTGKLKTGRPFKASAYLIKDKNAAK